jgi:hypothetical protein
VLRCSEEFGLPVPAYLDIGDVCAVQPSDGRRHRARRGLSLRMFIAATLGGIEGRTGAVIGRQRSLESERAWSSGTRAAPDDGVLQPRLRSRVRRGVLTRVTAGDGLIHSRFRAGVDRSLESRAECRVSSAHQARQALPRDHRRAR